MNTTTTVSSTRNPELFEKAISGLNRKARRLGVPEIEYSLKSKRKAPVLKRTLLIDGSEVNETNITVEVEVFDYEVSHVDIHQPGWSILARVSSIEGENFVETFAEDVDRRPYKSINPCHCDHCQTNRKRSASWIIRKDNGKELQVGSTCLVELVGGLTANALNFASLVIQFLKVDLESPEETEGGCSEYCSTIEALAAVEAHIEASGYPFRENRWGGMGVLIEQGTHRHVAQMLREHRFPFSIITDSHRKTAEAHIAAVCAMEGDSEFLDEMQYCLSQPYVPSNKLGLICYTHALVKREAKKREQAQLNATRSFIGEKGKREDFELTCTKVIGFDTGYGYTYMNLFEDQFRNVAVWKTQAFQGSEGKTYKVKGTVSDHGYYRGTPQTTLKRCKVEETPALVA